MIYNLANGLGIIVGSILGIFLNRGIPERINKVLLKAMGLCVLFIGISLLIKGENTLLIVISVALGTLLGEAADIDKCVNKLGVRMQVKFKSGSSSNSFAESFVTSSILFCAGAMGIVGSLTAGLTGNGDTLLAKAIIDGIISVVFAATLGIGVMFSSVAVVIYQSVFILMASLVSSKLGDPVIASVSGVGGIAMLGIGLNMSIGTDIKVANIAPAIFIPIILGLFGIF
ncbi:MAG: DUF554 domain-containing protein [Peptostreptococcus anaerobius]